MKNEECGKYRIWSAGHSVAAVMGALVRSDLHWDGNIQSTKTSMFHSAAAPAAVKPNFPNYGPTAL